MIRTLSLSLLAVLASSCAAPAQIPTRGWTLYPPIDGVETIYAVEAGRDAVRIRVPSNGCTQKADFRIDNAGLPGLSPSLLVRRTRRDECKSFAIGSAWITFSYEELGIAGDAWFTIVNPMTAWRGPGD